LAILQVEHTLATMTQFESLAVHLRGVLAFPITPYAADGHLDLARVYANARWLPDAGIDAVTAGT
jgi:dihydrodipicolinate synthase/N-acetylneuraminate lyase